jgi:hypothetical protein
VGANDGLGDRERDHWTDALGARYPWPPVAHPLIGGSCALTDYGELGLGRPGHGEIVGPETDDAGTSTTPLRGGQLEDLA